MGLVPYKKKVSKEIPSPFHHVSILWDILTGVFKLSTKKLLQRAQHFKLPSKLHKLKNFKNTFKSKSKSLNIKSLGGDEIFGNWIEVMDAQLNATELHTLKSWH